MERGSSLSAMAWKVTLILIPFVTAGLLLWLRHVEVRALAQRTVSSYGTVPSFQLVNQDGSRFGCRAVGSVKFGSPIYFHDLPGTVSQ